ncbi:MAG TPA: DUF222 domain-containing protein [Steroidobacter sp.]
MNAAHYRFLMLIAEWDRRKGWGGDGATQSCAHWLNWKCGIDMGAAREKVRTARRYSSTRSTARPRTSSASFATSAAARKPRSYLATLNKANRQLTWFHDADGMLVIKARLPPEAGQMFIKAIEAAREELPPPETSAETPTVKFLPQPSARKADALAIVAESFLAQGPAALKGGDRNQIVIHVDAETLRDSTAGRCNFEHGSSVSAETCRRLSCDCSIVPIVENEDGEPLNVGRKTRSIPPALHRAMNSRDKGCCRFPGCPNTRYLDGHHIKHWAHGGETKLSNLVSLCRFHHRQVHEGNVVVFVLDDDAVRFVTPSGRSFDSTLRDRTQPLGDWRQLIDQHEEQGLQIDRRTAATRWDGGACDYSWAVEALLRRSYKSERS